MKISWQSKVVNPSLPTFLDGYIRGRKSEEIHDDITLQVLLIQSKETIAIITLDVLLIDETLKEQVQKLLVNNCGLKEENILITASHTHSAPQISSFLFPNQSYNKSYRQQIIDSIEEMVKSGLTQMIDANMSYKKVDTHKFYSNRDSQKLPYNPWSYIVRFCDDSGKVIVDILNFLCHPTVLHAENIAVSTDLIGGIRKAYNQPLMILLGECGDVSTRFTRKKSSFAEVARLSQEISEQLKSGTWQALSSDELSVQTLVFDNTYHPSEDQFLLKSQQKLQLLVQQDENCQPLLEHLTNRLKQSTQTMHLQATVVKLGELAMVFLPCEIAYALGKELREVKDKILVVGYTNGFLGYAVNQDAYEQIAESLISEIPYGQADKIFHSLAQTLLKLK